MPRLHLRLLGSFDARIASGAPLALPAGKVEALLAYLALPAGRALRRDAVTALVWAETEPSQARHSLRQALSSLRKALAAAGQPLVVSGETFATPTGSAVTREA